jgi:Tfp pilus assembly protein PilP
MSTTLRRLLPALVALPALGACGDGEEDEGAPAPPPSEVAAPVAPARPAGRPGAPGTPGAPGEVGLQVYSKVEDVVPEEERATIRHLFRDRDFMSDPTGSENRDPFRSFVINQPGLVFDTGQPSDVSDVCSKAQLVASKHAMRDLRLVGIVSRSTRRYALFQDTSDLGHIVTRGDCVGKEKARVKDIGAGFVTLELVPEAAPGQAPRATEERSIPLYPEELAIPDFDQPQAPPPPPALPPPTMPSPENTP